MNRELFSKKNKDAYPLWFDLILVSFLILMGTLSRYILVGLRAQPFPNFELIMVLTFVSLFLIRPALVFLIPLFSMILSDLLLGNPVFVGSSMNNIVLFTYTGFLIASFLFLKTKNKTSASLSQITMKSVGICLGVGMAFTLVYDVWTNIGWWYLMFPHTIESFVSVFLAGIPFMIYHQLSTVFTFLTIGIPIGYLLTKNHPLTLPSKKDTLDKIPLIAVATILILLSFSGSSMATLSQTDIWLEDASETSVTLSVIGSSWMIKDQFTLTTDQSVLDVLVLLSNRHGFSVETSYYEAYDATLITSINRDIDGTDGYYWQYLVNGEAPMTGADNTFVSNGDVIHWHFSQFS